MGHTYLQWAIIPTQWVDLLPFLPLDSMTLHSPDFLPISMNMPSLSLRRFVLGRFLLFFQNDVYKTYITAHWTDQSAAHCPALKLMPISSCTVKGHETHYRKPWYLASLHFSVSSLFHSLQQPLQFYMLFLGAHIHHAPSCSRALVHALFLLMWPFLLL